MPPGFVYLAGEAPAQKMNQDLICGVMKRLSLSDWGSLARVCVQWNVFVQHILDAKWTEIQNSMTFGRDKWLNIPGVVTVSDEPPLTEDQIKSIKAKCRETCQVFNEKDPIQPHRFQNDKVKRTWQTHILIFFPEFINDDRRSLNVIGSLFRFEREGDNPTVFEWMPGNEGDAFRNRSPQGSYWRWVPRDIFPGSRRTLPEKKLEIVRNKGCMVPSPGDAATAELIMNLGHSHEDGDYFFGRGGNGKLSTYTATDGEYDGWGLVVGAAAPSGLCVDARVDDDLGNVGVAGFSEVL
jgi:hypothetical protein